MKQPFRKLADKLNYRFANESLLEQALTHRSASNINNERLEFLGDAVLNHLIAAELYRRFPDLNEGELSRLRSSLVKGETLAAMAAELKFGDYLILGPGESKTGGAQRRSILAGALEAIIGAIYLDGGFNSSSVLIADIYQRRFETIDLGAAKKDAKTRLQEYLQSRAMALPEYSVRAVDGPSHAQFFAVECRIEGFPEPVIGQGSSRRKAEQDAAARTLDMLQGSSQ